MIFGQKFLSFHLLGLNLTFFQPLGQDVIENHYFLSLVFIGKNNHIPGVLIFQP